MIHHLALAMALCQAPKNGEGQFVGLTTSQAAHLRYDRYHQLRTYRSCRHIAGLPDGPIPVAR